MIKRHPLNYMLPTWDNYKEYSGVKHDQRRQTSTKLGHWGHQVSFREPTVFLQLFTSLILINDSSQNLRMSYKTPAVISRFFPRENYFIANKHSINICRLTIFFCLLQKVIYRKGEYNSSSIYTSVVKSCSVGTCIPTNESDNSYCEKKDRLYKVYGCSFKTCCDDKDFCNSGLRNSSYTQNLFLTFLSCFIIPRLAPYT